MNRTEPGNETAHRVPYRTPHVAAFIRLAGAFWMRLGPYLPLIIMAVFAMMTFWLVRSVPSSQGAQPDTPPGHDPDYFFIRFGWRTFDTDGRLAREILGEAARHFPDTGTVEIDHMQLAAWGDDGTRTTARANHADIDRSRTQIHLTGAVRALRDVSAATRSRATLAAAMEPPWEYASEALLIDRTADRWSSPVAVTLRHGGQAFRADSMRYDRSTGTLTLTGRVRGEFRPTSDRRPS